MKIIQLPILQFALAAILTVDLLLREILSPIQQHQQLVFIGTKLFQKPPLF
jgi:hypothetical protein